MPLDFIYATLSTVFFGRFVHPHKHSINCSSTAVKTNIWFRFETFSFSERFVSRKRKAVAILERCILSESKKLDKFREQLENIHAEESTVEEEEGSTEEEHASSADEEEEDVEEDWDEKFGGW